MRYERLRSKKLSLAFPAPVAAVICALAMGGAVLADDTGSDDGQAPPPPAQADPPHFSIDMELCVEGAPSCWTLPYPGDVAAGNATLTVECENGDDDDDCADTPVDKASVNVTEKNLVNDAADFDLGTLAAGESRAMVVKIWSSTHENRYEAGVNFNLNVED